MKKKFFMGLATGFFLLGMSTMVSATAVSITNGSGAVDYVIGPSGTLPYTLTGDYNNDNVLYLWDEVQNFTLTDDLFVDRVADVGASYVGGTAGSYFITAGTIVSSHYVQWDPEYSTRVEATLNFDSDIFAFITNDDNLTDSDFLGLPGINYGNFSLRGLEGSDTTAFNSGSVDINWYASSPGDWTRLITAFSPAADPVPEPTTILLFGVGLVGLLGGAIRRKEKE